MPNTIGYLGPSGSFSQTVCFKLYPPKDNPDNRYIEFPSLNSLFEAIHGGALNLAVLPIRNSKGGPLKDNTGRELISQLLLPDAHLFIVGDDFLPLKFCLLGKAESTVEDIKIVHTNEYAEQQCRPYFSAHPFWSVEKHKSSSEAARVVSEAKDKEHAALASEQAAREYKLVFLQKSIFGDEKECPIMHFLVLCTSFDSTEAPGRAIYSAFSLQSYSEEKLITALRNSGLPVSQISASADYEKLYFLELAAKILPDQLSAVLPPDTKVKALGSYPINVEIRSKFMPLFDNTSLMKAFEKRAAAIEPSF
jgi:prephenate dehydratase